MTYTQVVYCFNRVGAVMKAKPELAGVEPFMTVLSGDCEAIAKLPMDDLVKVAEELALPRGVRKVYYFN
jgi:hypothetical protein